METNKETVLSFLDSIKQNVRDIERYIERYPKAQYPVDAFFFWLQDADKKIGTALEWIEQEQ